MEFFDSHAHYNDSQFEKEQENLLEEIYQAGVTKMICAGYDVPSSMQALSLAKKYAFVYATCGISPNDIPKEQCLEKELEQLYKIAKREKIVAIGEIGLDYHYQTENKQLQIKTFLYQIQLANECNLPIVIHTREAVDDTLAVLRKEPVKRKGVFHCCPFNKELVRQALQLGFYISFAGPVTFKNAKNAPEIMEMVPMEKMLIETDSPYLAPEPKRGKRNDSRNLVYIAQKIAEIKNCTLQEVTKTTYQNAESVFGIN